MKPRLVNLAVAVTSVVVTLVLLGLLGEGAVRWRESHRKNVPGTYSTLFYRQIRLRYALVHAYDYYGWVHVDSAGFRGGEVHVQKPANVLRIMAVGASTTFDRGVTADSLAWPARLQHWLQAQPTGAPRIQVVNAGVSGYLVIDNVIRLETELFQYKPDIIILYQAHNDLFRFLGNRLRNSHIVFTQRPDETRAITPWERWLEQHSLLYAKLLGKLRALNFRSGRASHTGLKLEANPVEEDSILRVGAENFARNLTAFVVVAKSLGIRVVLCSVAEVSGDLGGAPNATERVEWRNAVPFATPAMVLRGYQLYNAAIKAVAQKQSVPFIAADRFGLTGTRWYEAGDPIHFNDAGAEQMGRLMARALRATDVVGQSH